MLAVLTSHPIQYQAPLWRALAQSGLPFQTWFLTPHAVSPSFDPGFRKVFSWDQDLTAGYEHRFMPIDEGWRIDRFRGVRVRSSWSEELLSHHITHLWVEGWRFHEFWRAIRAAKRLGITVMLRGETNDLKVRKPIRDRAHRFLLSRLFMDVDYFLCIGSANRRFYERFGITNDRFLWAPYAVDNDRLRAAASERQEARSSIRSRWGIPANSKCLLFCGKLIPKKRPLDLIAAASLLGGGFHLLFAGSGQLQSEIEGRTAAGGLSASAGRPIPIKPTASFTGFLNQGEIVDAYVASDLLVLPSDSGETWGLVVNEAMACGLPVVVSDQCGSAEDLAIEAGAVFQCGDVKALATAIRRVLGAPPTQEAISTAVSKNHFRQTVQSVRDFLLQPQGLNVMPNP